MDPIGVIKKCRFGYKVIPAEGEPKWFFRLFAAVDYLSFLSLGDWHTIKVEGRKKKNGKD